ncbi:MAG: class II aldolase/adducin family protein, partial [Nitrospirota bacterium]|nr:class II aldolase/adducin family protein [Nitrospirota bacterium]
MKFAVIKNDRDQLRDKAAEAIIQRLLCHGHKIVSSDNDIRFVVNLTDIESPQFFRRSSRSIFVLSIVSSEKPLGNLRSICYTTLVRSLSNIVLCIVPSHNSSPEMETNNYEIYFTTPEAGFYHIPFDPEKIYNYIIPLAGSHFAIGNQFFTDLPPRFWKGSPVVEKIKEYGQELDRMGVLPTPFPLRELLSEENIQHLYTLFEIKGLSYGNLSAREHIPELGETTFWMSARGINKAQISKVGKDVLLVKGFDYEQGEALVSVPPEFDEKARVSVDTVEHELIYSTFPDVDAIVHVHAWMDGVLCTQQNYPCGTYELAQEVVNLLRQTDN